MGLEVTKDNERRVLKETDPGMRMELDAMRDDERGLGKRVAEFLLKNR